MPAITVEDTSALARLDAVACQSPRLIRTVTSAPKGFEGEGFPVRRAFEGVDLRELDPFIHLDQIGEVNYAPGDPKGTPWHPHRGFTNRLRSHPLRVPRGRLPWPRRPHDPDGGGADDVGNRRSSGLSLYVDLGGARQITIENTTEDADGVG